MRPDRRSELVTELQQLSPRELRRVLQPLGPGEREQVLAFLQPQPVTRPPAAFDTLITLSPWLLKAIEMARSDSHGGERRLSAGTCDALAIALDRLNSRRPHRPASRGAQAFLRRLRSPGRAGGAS